MTRRWTIGDALVDALNASTPGGVPQTRKNRGSAQPANEPLSISHRFVREEIDEGVTKGARPLGGGIRRRRLIHALDCRARGTETTTGEEELDPLLEWITNKLDGSRLGGLVLNTIEAQIDWESAQADRNHARATVYVVTVYETLVADATSPVPA